MDMSNLPPGVHERDIPGNRSEDAEWSAIVADVGQYIRKKLLESHHFGVEDFDSFTADLCVRNTVILDWRNAE